MKRIVKLIFLNIFLALGFVGESQILDDSTKLRYGAHTTSYVLEEDITDNTGEKRNADTSISGFHNYDLLYQGRLAYQNLGNYGTPLGYIYYLAPPSIGRSFGFNAYDPYAFTNSSIKYFDTKSPFTSITYIQGVNGQQGIDAAFARNIKPHWNVGFDIRRFTSRKVIGFPLANENQSDHYSFVIFSRFFTKDSTYQLLGNFNFLDHKNSETGGIIPDTNLTTNEVGYYGYKKQNVYLHRARSYHKRANFHLYHQLAPIKGSYGIQVFHQLDYISEYNRFNDILNGSQGSTDKYYYPNRQIFLPALFDANTTNDKLQYSSFENKVGLKGKALDINYRVYFRRRDITYTQYYFTYHRFFSENIMGAIASYQLPVKGRLAFDAEYLLARDPYSKSVLPSGYQNDYRVKLEYVSKLLTAGYYRVVSSPTLLQQIYYGNNLYWNNESRFVNPASDNFYAHSTYEFNRLIINPALHYSTIKNYVYFDTLALPAQYKGTINYLSAELFLKFNVGKFYIENLIKYASASTLLQVPQIYNHSRIYFQSRYFRKALLAQIGFDVFYRSAYFANYYMPITQQFYLNSGSPAFNVPSYVVPDFFINVRVKAANGFIKVSNFTQGWLYNGYMNTPYYPGMYFNFEFGIRWLFFD